MCMRTVASLVVRCSVSCILPTFCVHPDQPHPFALWFSSFILGFDEGTVILELGHDGPVASMDCRAGKLVYCKDQEVHTAHIQHTDEKLANGEAIQLNAKSLGPCDMYPQKVEHNPNGRLIVSGCAASIVICLMSLMPFVRVSEWMFHTVLCYHCHHHYARFCTTVDAHTMRSEEILWMGGTMAFLCRVVCIHP